MYVYKTLQSIIMYVCIYQHVTMYTNGCDHVMRELGLEFRILCYGLTIQ